jgi:hypothetical protein
MLGGGIDFPNGDLNNYVFLFGSSLYRGFFRSFWEVKHWHEVGRLRVASHFPKGPKKNFPV